MSPDKMVPMSPSKRNKVNQVAAGNPVHSCPNKCGYGLCHGCFVRKSIETEKEPRVRRQGQTKLNCEQLHKLVNQLHQLEEPAYFVESYVEKNGKQFIYPKNCAKCKHCFVIIGKQKQSNKLWNGFNN